MVFNKDEPENEKLVLKRSILGLGRVMYLDVARMLEQRERERERKREREVDRQTDGQTNRQRQRQRPTDKREKENN